MMMEDGCDSEEWDECGDGDNGAELMFLWEITAHEMDTAFSISQLKKAEHVTSYNANEAQQYYGKISIKAQEWLSQWW